MKKSIRLSSVFALTIGGVVACPWPGPNGYPVGYIEPYSVATNRNGGAGGLLVVDHYPPERELRVSLRREFGEGNLEASLVSAGIVQPRTQYLKLEQNPYTCFVALADDFNEGECFRGDGELSGAARVAGLPALTRESINTELVETGSEKWAYGVPAQQLFDGSYEEIDQRWQENLFRRHTPH